MTQGTGRASLPGGVALPDTQPHPRSAGYSLHCRCVRLTCAVLIATAHNRQWHDELASAGGRLAPSARPALHTLYIHWLGSPPLMMLS